MHRIAVVLLLMVALFAVGAHVTAPPAQATCSAQAFVAPNGNIVCPCPAPYHCICTNGHLPCHCGLVPNPPSK